MIRQAVVVAAITSLSFANALIGGSSAIAQVEQQYVKVGEGLRGTPMYLDLASVRGTNFRLIQQYGDGVGIIEVAAYCPQKRLFTMGVGVYNSKGEVISEDTERTEEAFVPGTPAVNAFEIVCKKGNRSAISGSSQQP